MSEKNIIFDLDHTLGFFEQLIHMIQTCEMSCHELLQLFPELFRPLFMDFLQSLIPYKKSGKVKSILIYSNNPHDEFVNTIVSFIHTTIGYVLFDEIITGSHPLRRKKYKDYHELIEISQGLSQTSLICFIDDKLHPHMKCKNVQYILCEGYTVYIKHSRVISQLKKEIPKYSTKKRCLNKHNQLQVSSLLIHRIRIFILR